jgi:hypothetical protein
MAMTAERYREAIAQLGYNITTVCPVLGISPRQSNRYAALDRRKADKGHAWAPIPDAVGMVLELAIRHGLKLEDVRKLYDRS